MKISIIILSILTSLGGGAYMLAHKADKPISTEVFVISDITEETQTLPTIEEIFSLFELQYSQNGAVFHFSNISDVGMNTIITKNLPTANLWNTNELAREKEIKTFQNEITQTLHEANQNKTGKENSSVFKPIATALQDLSESQSEKKILVVYSDLMENTSKLSMYDKNTLKHLQTRPETISNILESETAIPNLSNITVYLVYNPQTPIADNTFQIVSSFYKSLLESKGAKVKKLPNLP